MKFKLSVAAAMAAGLVGPSGLAQNPTSQSQSPELTTYFEEHVSAPKNAFELTLGTGYTQGFGMLQGGVGMPNVVTPGLAIDLGGAYRLDPRWSLGITGQYQEMMAERATGARGLTGGIAAAYHIAPYVRSDPWIQLGTGYRLLWETHESPAATVLSHGFELAKVAAGLDLRFTQDVAIAPVIGADLNVFVWQDGANAVAIRDPRLSTFVFAGAMGRFDLGATHQAEPGRTTASR